MTLLRKSPLLFIHLLCWTQVFADFSEAGDKLPTKWTHRPFVLWPAQDREMIVLHRCVQEGKWRRCVKSREMGWSWMETVYDLFMFCTQPDSHVLVASRKEEEVDKDGRHTTIFAKHIYNLDRMPSWILPQNFKRVNLLLTNPANGAEILGESTNEDVGRSGRSHRAWIDEASAVPNLESVIHSVGENTNSLSLIGTARVGSHFGTLASSSAYEQRSMWWFEHPGKAQGVHADDKAPGKIKLISPWKAVQERKGRRYVAVEIEGDEGAAGDMLFDPRMLEATRAANVSDNAACGDLVFSSRRDEQGAATNATVEPEELAEADERLRRRDGRAIRFEHNPDGAWRLFCPLVKDSAERLRPPQDTVYVIGGDPGDGRQGANSALYVVDAFTGRQVATFLSARYSSRDLARIMAAASLWFGGKRPALMIWETNGVGGATTEMLCRQLNAAGLFRKKVLGREDNPQTESLGWSSTAPKKRILLDTLIDRMTAPPPGSAPDHTEAAFRPVDARFYDEARMFVIVEGGWVTQGTRADLPTGAREAHGDLVIAAGLACWGMDELPRQTLEDEDRAAARFDLSTWEGRNHRATRDAEQASLPRWQRAGVVA